jgi:hypothetical protein
MHIDKQPVSLSRLHAVWVEKSYLREIHTLVQFISAWNLFPLNTETGYVNFKCQAFSKVCKKDVFIQFLAMFYSLQYSE